ncbi:efflux RND transporter periplasmic adaptor subunit [Legionella worsleiensis]|uniref:HlyD family transporter secretion protein n=1 Tax=Legionella worsleiensis TaxID=45076 RepID=A0A0W1A648_9GAMM|nr:efflux RND transporter periplasmic adaptor subunit [Legionella worsleiensis]KTD76728.1 HlyD family transporter secretion protein [Legionella worsleiensis]STY30514.1 HlyD family secretion protein [Legionella worsleiensis]
MNTIKSVLLAILSLLAVSCDNPASQAPTAPLEVDVAKPLIKKIVEWDEYTGRFQAIEEVDIRSRVTGYLNTINFKDGQIIKKGEVLFEIDPRPFQYALEVAIAEEDLAKKQYERALKLKASSFISAEAIDQRYKEMQVAATRVSEAKLNLEFTRITAPISGRISRYFVSVGNLIKMNDTVLTKIVSLDPIYFYFEFSQNDLLKHIRLIKSATPSKASNNLNSISLKLQDETQFVHQGTMDFIDNVVDKGTGTVQGRATIPNPEHIIYPGLFGRARLISSREYDAILLPDKAINVDQTKNFVYIVDKENKIQRVYVELGPLRDSGYYVIKSGLKGDELVVISGIQRIRSSDQKVKPVVIKLSE